MRRAVHIRPHCDQVCMTSRSWPLTLRGHWANTGSIHFLEQAGVPLVALSECRRRQSSTKYLLLPGHLEHSTELSGRLFELNRLPERFDGY
jgi:hypothetical protein